MFKKEKEEIRTLVDEKTKQLTEKSQFITVLIIAGSSLSIGFLAGALSSAILFNAMNN